MKMKALLLTMAAGFCLWAMPVTALAAEDIDEVYISLVSEDQIYSLNPGEILSETEPSTPNDDEYWISHYSYSGSGEPGKTGTYTIDLECDSEYRFTSDTEITIYGAYELSVSSRNSRKLSVKAKTYPFHVLGYVSGISIDESGKKVSWDKVDYAKNYSVKIYYTDKNGNDRSTKKSTSSSSLSLSSYIGKYENVRVSVKAAKGSSTSDRYIAESGYVFENGNIDSDEETDQYDFRVPTATRSGTREESRSPSGSSGSSGGPGVIGGSGGPGVVPGFQGNSLGPGYNSTSPGTAAAYTGWQGSGNNWYYLISGVKATGWVQPTANEWYLLDGSGLMLSGWQRVGNVYYYLNPNHDGTFGKMMVGLQNIGGVWYYLNEQHDGTYGALYMNRYIPDGRYAGANGVIIQR